MVYRVSYGYLHQDCTSLMQAQLMALDLQYDGINAVINVLTILSEDLKNG